jgi:hypothetical protein
MTVVAHPSKRRPSRAHSSKTARAKPGSTEPPPYSGGQDPVARQQRVQLHRLVAAAAALLLDPLRPHVGLDQARRRAVRPR